MGEDQFDDIDRQILAALQVDASQPMSRVAEEVGLSIAACTRRIRRLTDEGVIVRRVAILDPAKLGLGTTVFMSIRVKEHSEAWLDRLAAAVSGFEEVIEFYRLSGEPDYLVKLKVSDIAAYDRVYKRLIAEVDLADVRSAFALQELKLTTALPLERKADGSRENITQNASYRESM